MIRDSLTKLSEKENFEEKISAINLLKSEKGDPFFLLNMEQKLFMNFLIIIVDTVKKYFMIYGK